MKLVYTLIIALVSICASAQSFVFAYPDIDATDVNSGKNITIKTGDVLKLIKDADSYNGIYKTAKGNEVSVSKNNFITLSEYQKLVAKYGKRMVISALNDKVIVGMPVGLVKWLLGKEANYIKGKGNLYVLVYVTKSNGDTGYMYLTVKNNKVFAVTKLDGNLMDGYNMDFDMKH